MEDESSHWRTRAVEDFLRTVYILQQTTIPVPMTLISRTLHITAPSVTDMIRRLGLRQSTSQHPHGYYPSVPLLEHKPYHGVCLTSAGEQIALQVIRRRRLLELYLVQRLGYTWDEVETEADRLEHDVSEQLAERLAVALGNPEADPHGEPIPTAEGSLPTRGDLALMDLKDGQDGIVSQITDHFPELLHYLSDLGLRPGVKLRVLSHSPLGDIITVYTDTPSNTHILSSEVASHLHVISQQKSQTEVADHKPGLTIPGQGLTDTRR